MASQQRTTSVTFHFSNSYLIISYPIYLQNGILYLTLIYKGKLFELGASTIRNRRPLYSIYVGGLIKGLVELDVPREYIML